MTRTKKRSPGNGKPQTTNIPWYNRAWTRLRSSRSLKPGITGTPQIRLLKQSWIQRTLLTPLYKYCSMPKENVKNEAPTPKKPLTSDKLLIPKEKPSKQKKQGKQPLCPSNCVCRQVNLKPTYQLRDRLERATLHHLRMLVRHDVINHDSQRGRIVVVSIPGYGEWEATTWCDI